MWPKSFRGFEEVRAFLITLSLIISFFVSAIFLGIYLRSNALLLHTVREQARSYLELIVQTRIWNARYGSVYVEKKAGVESNQYLREVGIEPDISCEGNRIFTMKNPALMTREISLITGSTLGVKFHITSLKPINPENAPDAFEKKALQQFEKGMKEMWLVEQSPDASVYRYMAPLFVEEPCLACHARQGYRKGEIRGGISVSIPLGGLQGAMRTNKFMIILLSVLTILLLLLIVYALAWKLVSKLSESRRQLMHMSVTDELTGLRNRRYIMERLGQEFQRARREAQPMGLIMLDLDFFKELNDTFGHRFGDMVLTRAASRIRVAIREYDLLGRIGGEEFLIVAPDSSREETILIAERIRDIVREKPFVHENREAHVTISAGITMLTPDDPDIDTIFSRADNALYLAKKQGRDRVAAL
jgi:diguanylate cyclase (GGDEF)-like protein